MKYKVTMKISYFTVEFLFDDRMEALDFMETVWAHRLDREDKISAVTLTFDQEEEQEEQEEE